MSGAATDWYDGFFEGEWLDQLALGTPETNDRQVDFLAEHLPLDADARVLDLACGRGRIAIRLAQRGCRVTGMDLSPRSLELARAEAEAAGVEIELVHRDMRELDAVESFDVVLNLWSSFGYFADRADDERVLAAVSRSLVPSGTFFIDTINPVALAASFTPRTWRELDAGVLHLEERSYDQLTGRTETTWTFVHPDGSRSALSFSVRAYTAAELVAMLRDVGLEVDRSWGTWDEVGVGEGRRILLRARKAAT